MTTPKFLALLLLIAACGFQSIAANQSSANDLEFLKVTQCQAVIPPGQYIPAKNLSIYFNDESTVLFTLEIPFKVASKVSHLYINSRLEPS